MNYEAFLKTVLNEGVQKGDRTGTGTISYWGGQLRFDLNEGFPLITTKKIPFRWVAEELFWFLSGSTNVKDLQARGVDIWDEWATKEQCEKFGREPGDLGPIYGWAWRNFGGSKGVSADGTNDPWVRKGFDQIARVIHDLKKNPNSRRHIVTGWNPVEADAVALPPCHTLFQFGVSEGRLNCHLYQRSADMFLGVPFNIASYALLTHLIAHCTDLKPGVFVHSFGDAHVYNNHIEQVQLQLSRAPMQPPTLTLRDGTPKDIDQITYADIQLKDYISQPSIKAEVSV